MAFGFKKKAQKAQKASPATRGHDEQVPPYDDSEQELYAPSEYDEEYEYGDSQNQGDYWEQDDNGAPEDYRQGDYRSQGDYRRPVADDRYDGDDSEYDKGYGADSYDQYDDDSDRYPGNGYDGYDDDRLNASDIANLIDEDYDDGYDNGRNDYPDNDHDDADDGYNDYPRKSSAASSEIDWGNQWASEQAFEEGNDDNSDLQEAEFGEEYVDGPRRRQNMPLAERTRDMAETFVDRFRNGGTVGRKTATKRIVTMQAISESDIPIIKRRLRRSNVPYNILMVIFASIVVGASGYLYNYFSSLSQNDAQMDAITAKFTTPISSTPTDTGTDMEIERVKETDMPPIVDFDGLKSLNKEVSSWLRVPDTTIDYPVMTTDVPSKYLRLDIEGNYSIPGCLFTDWDNWNEDMNLVDEKHIVIYGHHLPWAAMFHDMSLYLEEPGFVDGHRKIYYETPEQTYVLNVIGVHKAKPEEWQARKTIFNDEHDFQQYVDERLALNQEVYDSGDYDRKTINKFFTFITCTDSGSARCIVNAIVVEQYPTSYVPLVRAKMQHLIKADGTIDPVKEAQLLATQQAEALAQQQAEEQQQQQEQQGAV